MRLIGKLHSGLLVLLCFIVVQSVTAQPGFNMHIDTEGPSRRANNIINHNDTLYFSGPQRELGGLQDIFFASADSNGQLLFLETVSDTGSSHLAMDRTATITRNRNGNFLVVGTPISRPGNLLFKFSSFGELLWRQEYFPPSGVNTTFVRRLIELKDGYMIGATYSFSGSNSRRMAVIRTDREGNELWRKVYGDSQIRQFLVEMIVLENGNILLSGGNSSLILNPLEATWSQSQFYIIDTAGNVLDSWQSEIDQESTVVSLNEVEDGFIYATYHREYIPQKRIVIRRPRLVRRKWDFSEVWRLEVSNMPADHFFRQIYHLADGNHLAVGTVFFPGEEDRSCVFKFTPDGEILWTTCTRVPGYGHESNSYELVGVTELSSGSIVVSGTHDRPGDPRKNIAWLVKMDADGCITDSLCLPVSVTEEVSLTTGLSTYPNPATDRVTFELTGSGGDKPVSIGIHDAMGRSLHRHSWEPGSDQYEWDATAFSPGIYFYRLQFENGEMISGKVILLR